jgi:hypothetical protein
MAGAKTQMVVLSFAFSCSFGGPLKRAFLAEAECWLLTAGSAPYTIRNQRRIAAAL